MSGDRRFFDLQVNGYAGVDFNGDDLSPELAAHACRQLQSDGVAGILATVITDRLDVMCRRIERIVAARQADSLTQRIIHGIHLEGPFLNEQPGFAGAHPPGFIRPATIGDVEPLVAASRGLVRLVTLAPERDANLAVTRWLVEQQIRVAAGHCDPSLDQLRAAIDAGLSIFTHLGNGCPLLLARHDNIVQRVLGLSDRLWVCFIADGIHVPFVALGNYLKCVGTERAVVVSDAISAAGMGPGQYSLGGQMVYVDDDLATWSIDRSHLMGSAATMARAHANLESELNLSAVDLRKLTYSNPRSAIGVGLP